jgi:F-type H+-transporting ATPase subunit delta
MATVTSTYARAFADVVMSNRLDATKTLAEAQQISALVRESKALRQVWEAPSIPAEQKRALLDAIVRRAGISRPVRNFVAVLIDKRRMKFLAEIVAQFAQELNQRLGFAEAEITTSRELSREERSELEQDLARVTGKKIKARYAQDRAILGGAVARVGSTVYDGSVRGQLERIRQQLTGTGV